VDEVIRKLSRKKDCKLYPWKSEIEILDGTKTPKQNDLGNGSWGMLDYLTKYEGWVIITVSKFTVIKKKKNNGN